MGSKVSHPSESHPLPHAFPPVACANFVFSPSVARVGCLGRLDVFEAFPQSAHSVALFAVTVDRDDDAPLGISGSISCAQVSAFRHVL